MSRNKKITNYKAEHTRVKGWGLRLRDKLFVNKLLEHDGIIIKAYDDAFPGEKDLKRAAKMSRANKILERPYVKEYMEEIVASKEIGVESVLGGLADIAKNAGRDSDKIKALGLLGKYLKMFNVEKQGTTNNILNLRVNEDVATRLLQRRKEYEIDGGGGFLDVKPTSGGSVIDGEEIVD